MAKCSDGQFAARGPGRPGKQHRAIGLRERQRGIEHPLKLVTIGHDVGELRVAELEGEQLGTDLERDLAGLVELVPERVQLGQVPLDTRDTGDLSVRLVYRHGVHQQGAAGLDVLIDRQRQARTRRGRLRVIRIWVLARLTSESRVELGLEPSVSWGITR